MRDEGRGDGNHGSTRPMFSIRSAWDTTESDWSRALTVRRATGLPIHDLTVANPTDCEFTYPSDLLDPLQNPAGLRYTADPQGLLTAREAVCAYYSDHAASFPELASSLDPSRIVLTTSTSEAYSYLFRLLCDPGDEILIGQPGYPLFDFLADLDGVRLVTYPLFYDYGWHLDMHSLRAQITPRTRAIVLVHPNNPTGHFTSMSDRRMLDELCAERDLALIVDEVFLDYSLTAPAASFALGEQRALTFVLSGLSKVCALPQMKLSWIAALGPASRLVPALARLEVIADTFLSLSAPMQLALPAWLHGRDSLQRQIRQRVNDNLAWIDAALPPAGSISSLKVEGGWYAILRVPALGQGEQFALRLLHEHGVVVHAGVFFGLPPAGWVVISLLTPDRIFVAGMTKLLALGYELQNQ